MRSTPVDLSFSYLRSAVVTSLDTKKDQVDPNSSAWPLTPPPPSPHTHIQFSSTIHRLLGWPTVLGGICVRGRCDHAPTPQDNRVTDSDWGGRVRVGVLGLGLALGGGAIVPPCYSTWSWRGQTNILALSIHIAYDCIQTVTISAVGDWAEWK